MGKNKDIWNCSVYCLFLNKSLRNKFFGHVYHRCITNSSPLENHQISKQSVINITKELLGLINQAISWYNLYKQIVHFYHTLKSQKYYTIYPWVNIREISLAIIRAFFVESKILRNVTKKTLTLNEWFMRYFLHEILRDASTKQIFYYPFN